MCRPRHAALPGLGGVHACCREALPRRPHEGEGRCTDRPRGRDGRDERPRWAFAARSRPGAERLCGEVVAAALSVRVLLLPKEAGGRWAHAGPWSRLQGGLPGRMRVPGRPRTSVRCVAEPAGVLRVVVARTGQAGISSRGGGCSCKTPKSRVEDGAIGGVIEVRASRTEPLRLAHLQCTCELELGLRVLRNERCVGSGFGL